MQWYKNQHQAEHFMTIPCRAVLSVAAQPDLTHINCLNTGRKDANKNRFENNRRPSPAAAPAAPATQRESGQIINRFSFVPLRTPLY